MGDMSRWVFLMLLCLFQKGQAIWLTVPPTGTKCVSEELHSNVVVLADYYALPDDHNHPNPTISVKVSSPFGNTLYHKENITHGQFSFTTTEAGNYLACFWVDDGHNPGGKSLNVGLDWKIGIAAKDWESVARKEKIEPREIMFVYRFPTIPTWSDPSEPCIKWELCLRDFPLCDCKHFALVENPVVYEPFIHGGPERSKGIELELRKLEGAVEAIHENLIYLKSREAEMRSVSEITNTRVASFSLASLGICVLASVLQILYLKRYFQKKKLI